MLASHQAYATACVDMRSDRLSDDLCAWRN